MRLRRPAQFVSATLLAGASVVAFGSIVGAHDDIASSTPETRSTIDEPISEVEIDFGADIGDNTQLFLTYDLGDAEIEEIGGDTIITGETTARLEFDQIDKTGTYFVRYLAPIPSDGHVMAGAISFTWGSPSGSGGGSFPVVPFAIVAALVLAVGGWFSYRRMLQPVDDTDDELASPTSA